MGIEIDNLEIAIQSQAKDVSKNVDELYRALGNVATVLNRTSTSYRSAAKEVGRLIYAFRSLSTINIPDFSAVTTQVNALGLAIKKLQNKTIRVDVDLNLPKSASQVRYAIEDAIETAKGSAGSISETLLKEFHITSAKGKAVVREAVKEMVSIMQQGFDGENFNIDYSQLLSKNGSFGKIFDAIEERGKVSSERIGDEAKIASAGIGQLFHRGAESVLSEISKISDPDIYERAVDLVSDSVNKAIYTAESDIRTAYQGALGKASDQLTLDIQVNQDKIVRDIQNAINKAANVEYKPVEVKLSVNKQNISNDVSKELQNISTGNLTQISEAYENLFQSLINAHTVLGNSKAIGNIVNALTRLTNVDLSKFDTAKFNEIIATISSLASLGDVSASITKMVSALVRLSKVGDVVGITAEHIPSLGNALKDAFDKMASANVNETTERIMMAFTRLAMSGQKAQTAAQNLPGVTSAVSGFFDAMSQAPEINTTTLRMVEMFTQLAVSGKRIANLGGQISKSFYQVASSSDEAGRGLSKIGTHTNVVVNAFKRILDAVKNAIGGIGKGAKKIISHFRSIGDGSNHIQKATLSLKNLLQVALGFYGVRSLINMGKQSVELASDLTEVQNVVENSFGTKGTKLVEDFATSAVKNFGMTELTAKRISSRFQAMGNAMGITSGQVASATKRIADNLNPDMYDTTGDAMGAMSVNLTKLAADMASFYNVEQENVAEALNAVYTGQTRPLRQFGLDLTQATLETWALKHGIDADIKTMSQAEKTLLRYQYVMSNTATVQGDFARTADTWANQIRMLKQNLQALGSVVGEYLINAFKPFVAWLNIAISNITTFAETVGNALGKIFGWSIVHTPASNAADAYDTLVDSLEETGVSGGDAAQGIGEATKAAEEYQNTVMGFDELNKLNDVKDPTSTKNTGGGSGKGGNATGIPGLDGTGADFEIIRKKPWIEEYKSSIDSLFELGKYISDTLTRAMESIRWEDIYNKARDFGTGLADFLNGLITPDLFSALGGTIAGAINTALNAAEGFLDKFDFSNLGRSIASGVNRFFTDFDFGLSARVFYKAVNGLADTIVAACSDIQFEKIGSRISNAVRLALANIQWKEKVYPAADSFGEGIANFLNGLIKPSTFWKIGESIAGVLNTALHILDTFGNTFDFKNFGESVASSIKGFFEGWDADLTADTFNSLASGILTSLSTAIEDVNWKRIGAKISGMIANIEWVELLGQVGTVIINAINGVLSLAAGLFDGTPLSDAFEGLKSTINGVVGQIDFDGVANGLKAIFNAGSRFAEGFLGGLTTAFGILADFGVATLSGIGFALGIIGKALSAIDPEWVEKVGFALGVVASSLITIKGAEAVSGIISSVAGTFLGLGTATGVAAETTAEAATAMTAAETASSGATTKVTGFWKSLVTSAGFMEGAALTSAVSLAHSWQVMGEKAKGLNGYTTEMGAVIESLAVNYFPEFQDELLRLNDDLENSDASAEEASTAFAEFFKGKHIDPRVLETAFGSVMEQVGRTEEQQELWRQTMEKFNGTTETSATKLGGFVTSVESAKKAASNASDIKDSLGGAMDSIKEKSESADTKTGLFKTNLFGFAGGALAQSLLLAVLGTSFATMGDKAEGAQTPIDTLKSKVGGFVDGVKTWATDALSNSKSVGENIPKGMEDGIKSAKDSLDTMIKSTMIGDPQNAITHGWMTHSPSKVTYGYGENIVAGMKNAITAKGNTIVDAIKAIITAMKTAITGSYTDFYNKGDTLATRFHNGLKSVRFTDVTTSWWNDMNMSSLSSGLYDAGRTAAKSLANGLHSVSMPTLSYYISDWEEHSLGNGGTSYTPVYSPNWYRMGGFPNIGELFWANEQGNPEMVGKMGNKSVVANNMQIAAGIKEAVVDGMMQVFMATNSGDDEIPYVFNAVLKTENDEILARAVERGKARRDARFNTVGYSYG